MVVNAAAAAAAEQKIRIKLKAYDAQLLQQSVGLISDAASSTGARVSGPVYLPTRQVMGQPAFPSASCTSQTSS